MKIKRLLTTLAMCVGLTTSITATAQTNEDLGEPIITFKTNIYNTYGAENAFYIQLGATETDYYDVDCGYGPSEYEIEPAYFSNESSALVGTQVACSVPAGDGIVKIYGDASKIDYIMARGCYIEWIKMDSCLNLDIVDLCHNELKALDLTPFTKLQAIYVGDNPFTAETPLKIGAPKPNLAILEMDIVDHLDQSFNLSDYPQMITFDAYHNLGLRNVDPTGCPKLVAMSLDITNVETLDVTKNSNLVTLNISETRIKEIDLSGNPNLTTLIAQHASGNINTDVKLKKIDVSKNTKLTLMNLSGNAISDIDISKNTALVTLNMRGNNLSKIDVSKNTALYRVNLAYNDFDFTTLPLPQSTWSEYYYQRDPMPCNKSYALGSEIDFSSRVLRDSTDVYARVMIDTPDADPVELDSTYYTHKDGKVVFHKIPSDSVYIEYANTAFVDYTINTANFMVKNADEMGNDNLAASFTTTSAAAGRTLTFSVGLDKATAESPRQFHVSVNGTRTSFTATTDGYGTTANASVSLAASGTSKVEIYLPDGEVLTALSVKDVALSAIDVTAARQLRHLTVNGCNLLSIDTKYNRMLEDLNLSNNRLNGTFSLAGVYGDYEKNRLTDINLSKNYITSVTFVNTAHIKKLNLADNRIATITLKDFDGLTDLNLSNNSLSGTISLTYQGNAENIDLSNNTISEVTLVEMPNLKSFNIANNDMTLATLPNLTSIANYTYAPQKQIEIVAYAPAINLSEQNVEVNGAKTVFTLKKEDGTTLSEGTDYSGADGAYKFLKEDLGKVYCEMTHEAYPAFSGENALRTTMTTVTGAPTTVVASFTTTENSEDGTLVLTGHKNTAVYVDWRGDGTEYLQYSMVSNTYTGYEGQKTYAGANVKVYTYESPEDIKVFSISNVAMSKLDASALTKVETLTVCNAGLNEKSITMPASSGLIELNLEGNNFSTADFSEYEHLVALSIGNNKYSSYDASKLKELQLLNIANNTLSKLTMNNPRLWSLAASNNNLSTIDFAGVPNMAQVVLSHNELSTIDLSAIKNSLKVLFIDGNKFTFATLPVQSEYPSLSNYFYANQAVINVECKDGVVDLSALATANGKATVYTWYLGDATFDEDYGTYTGEALESPEVNAEDPEYEVENGVTTFHYTQDTYVTCVMTNETFPNMFLLTNKVTIDKAGVEEVAIDGINAMSTVDIYNLAGVKVGTKVSATEVNKLSKGVYIVTSGTETRKVVVR